LILALIAAIVFSGGDGRKPNPTVNIGPGGLQPGGAPGAGGLPGGVPQLLAPRDAELYSAAPYNKDGISIPSVIVRPSPGGGTIIYGMLTNTTGEPVSFSGTANILDANDKVLEQNVAIQTLRVIAPNATVPFVIQANQSRNGKRPDWKINAKPFRQDPAAAKVYPHNYFKSEKQSLKDGTPNMFAQGTVINTGPDDSGNLRAIMALYGPDNALLFVSPSVPLNESLDKGEEGDFDIPFPALPKDPNVGINQVKFLIWFEGAK
jgi:hypothetical protein